jgi:hypothetical protein
MTANELFEEVANRTQPDFFPPATTEELAQGEQALGRPLPELLRRLYGVANGGFNEVLGLTREAMDDEFTAIGLYEDWAHRGEDADYEAWTWPAAMLPFAYHGCTTFSCVDLDSGRVFSFDPGGFIEQGAEFELEEGEEPPPPTTREEFRELFVPEADSLEEWFNAQL